ncbi:MAG: Maf family nucleotide pyrophosphatase [Salinisphaeraceae bacterium]|nr:Maf family nucleotide pyrophosphatase [Salinisphaeraceae bacterium]
MPTTDTRLILGSSSPYRRELLQRFGLPFECISPDVDESRHTGESAGALSSRLAALKAQTVAHMHPDAVVIGSDQVLECNGELLGKPGNRNNAIEQLRTMSGQTLKFYTALCVCQGEKQVADLAVTQVLFRKLDDATIEAYLAREPAFDVAGSCKAESLGIALCDAIESDDPTALIGLPLIRLRKLLSQFGINVV